MVESELRQTAAKCTPDGSPFRSIRKKIASRSAQQYGDEPYERDPQHVLHPDVVHSKSEGDRDSEATRYGGQPQVARRDPCLTE